MLRIGVIGTGMRGFALSKYFLEHSDAGCITAAADPNQERLDAFCKLHNVPDSNRFSDYNDLLGVPGICDAVFVTTMDRLHYDAAMKALSNGYHVLLEKPMSPDPHETIALAQKSQEVHRLLMVCHELRYTPFFETLKSIIDSQEIGNVVSINLTENVEHIHFSHSFVRGNFSNSSRSSFMLLSKSCHDIDILTWLMPAKCSKVSSFGSLTHFVESNAPEGAPHRCTDGCPVEETCTFSAKKIYLQGDRWYRHASFSGDSESRLRAIQSGPYGRCVYHCDNDAVDHQVVIMEFEDHATATFSMMAFTKEETRTIKVFGTKGEIRGHMTRNDIEVSTWDGKSRNIQTDGAVGGHGGGDFLLVKDFVHQVETGNLKGGRTEAMTSAESHLVTFAAEHARTSGRIVDVDDYIATLY